MRKLFGATLLILMSSLAMAAQVQSKTKVIVDTDPGCDDAHALALLLNLADVKAITTVDGNVKAGVGAENVCRMMDYLHLYGIPVYEGTKCSMSKCQTEINATLYQGADGLNGFTSEMPNKSDKKPEKEKAAHDAINVLSGQSSRELTLVALGPLTNLAIAVGEDEKLPRRIKSVYIMGGSEGTGGNVYTADGNAYAEYNFYSDAKAAHETLQKFSEHTQVNIIPWETCNDKEHRISFDEFKGILEDAKDIPISRMLKKTGMPPWIVTWETSYVFADQLVAMVISYPESVLEAECYRTAEVNYNINALKYGQAKFVGPQDCKKDDKGNIKHRGIVVYRKLNIKKMTEGFKKVMNDDRMFGEKENAKCPDGYTKLNEEECSSFATEKQYEYTFGGFLNNVVYGCSFDHSVRTATYSTDPKGTSEDYENWTLGCKKS